MELGSCTFLVIQPDRGSGGEAHSLRKQGDLETEPPALGDFGGFTTKMIHFYACSSWNSA